MDKIIAIGGTGQDVLQHYCLAYLCGVVDPFDAVVLDADALRPGLKIIGSFFENAITDPTNRTALAVSVPSIRFAHVRPSGARVTDALLGFTPDDASTAADAFFHRDDLMQLIDQGLYARPALSSVLTSDLLKPELLLPDARGRVYIVGSVLGGTGGGLLARVIDATQEVSTRSGREPKIRAVLFGEYFHPDENAIEQKRMRSNLLAVLTALAEGTRHLFSYAIIDSHGGARLQQRARGDVLQLPFPSEEQNPFWRGLNTLDWLRGEETGERVEDFAGREVSLTFQHLKLHEIRAKLARARSAVEMFVQKNLPDLVLSEPWAELLWGHDLAQLCRGALRAVQGEAHRDTNAPKQQLAADLREVWNGPAGAAGLRDLFTSADSKVKPLYFAKLKWPNASAFNSQNGTGGARRAAANLLLHCMRGTQV